MPDDDLDGVVRRADPDRWLSSRFIADPSQRSDVIALYAFDHELERAGRVASNALLAEIRLTWWREALDEIFAGVAVRYHPAAARLTEVVRARNLPRAPLEAMIDGRIDALDAHPMSLEAAVRWSRDVAGSAAWVAGLILDPEAPQATTVEAGALWGLYLLASRGKVDRVEAATHIARVLPIVVVEAARLSPEAFPAVAHVCLARTLRGGWTKGPMARRLRLVAATLTGRL